MLYFCHACDKTSVYLTSVCHHCDFPAAPSEECPNCRHQFVLLVRRFEVWTALDNALENGYNLLEWDVLEIANDLTEYEAQFESVPVAELLEHVLKWKIDRTTQPQQCPGCKRTMIPTITGGFGCPTLGTKECVRNTKPSGVELV